MIWFLIIYVFLLLIISYILFGKRFEHPAVLFFSGALFVLILAAYMLDYFNYTCLTSTYLIFGLMYTVSFLSFIFYYYIFGSRKKVDYSNSFNININNNKLIILSSINILLTLIVLIDYRRVLGSFSFSTLSEGINAYRNDILDDGGISFISKQLVKIIKVIAYFSTIFLISNRLKYKIKIRKTIISFLFLVLPFLMIYLLQGERFSIAIYLVFLFSAYCFMKPIKYKTRYLAVLKVVLIPIIGVLLFGVSRYFVGRGLDSGSALDYAGHYFGNSFLNFDVWYRNDFLNSNSMTYGLSTFRGVTEILNSFGIVNGENAYSAYFMGMYNKYGIYTSTGNVFTCVPFYLTDFGIFGVILFPTLLSIISSKLYYSNRFKFRKFNLSKFIYLMFSGDIFLETYSSGYFNHIFNYNLIFYILILVVIIFCFNNKPTYTYSKLRYTTTKNQEGLSL